jgi:Holliday junction DNA helicase RuvA
MIRKLTGIVDAIFETHAIIDVGGVGYGVFAPARALASLVPNASASLWIETIVREDSIALYGFPDPSGRELFVLLLTVQGVGPKAALSILSALSPLEISTAVIAGDAKAFTGVNGIGGKTAARIVSELKDKIAKIGIGAGFAGIAKSAGANAVSDDAVAALASLGYTRSQAFEAVLRAVRENPGAALADLVKSALRHLNNL